MLLYVSCVLCFAVSPVVVLGRVLVVVGVLRIVLDLDPARRATLADPMEIELTAEKHLARDTVRRLSHRSDSRGMLQLALHVGLLYDSPFHTHPSLIASEVWTYQVV